MVFGSLIGLAIGLYFGAPLLPLLAILAVLQSVVAYVVTRDPVAIRITLIIAIATTGSFLIGPMLIKQMDSVDLSFPFPLEWFDYITFAIASIGFISATIIGLIGGTVASSNTDD